MLIPGLILSHLFAKFCEICIIKIAYELMCTFSVSLCIFKKKIACAVLLKLVLVNTFR
jgi:hypothetical protein